MPRKALTQDLAGSGIRFLRINADQSTSELTAAQALAAIESGSKGRASLSGNVTRTSAATLTNTGLSALDVPLAASSRYRVTYRIVCSIAGNGGGWQFGLNFGAVAAMSGLATGFTLLTSASQVIADGYPDWSGTYPSDASIGSFEASGATASGGDYLIGELTLDIITSGATTLKLLAGQQASDTDPLTIAATTCVEWVKF